MEIKSIIEASSLLVKKKKDRGNIIRTQIVFNNNDSSKKREGSRRTEHAFGSRFLAVDNKYCGPETSDNAVLWKNLEREHRCSTKNSRNNT